MNDRLQSIQDAFGNEQTFSYDGNPGGAYLVVHDQTSGRELYFYIGANGYIDRVVASYPGTNGSPAVTTRLTYDGTGHLTGNKVYFQNNVSGPVHQEVFTYQLTHPNGTTAMRSPVGGRTVFLRRTSIHPV